MPQGGTSIGYVIGGMFVGGIVAGLFLSSSASGAIPDSLKILISLSAPMVGIVLGYLLAFAFKKVEHEEARRVAEAIARSQPRKPPAQIAGKKCSECEQTIIFIADGVFCEGCFVPVCNACLGDSRQCASCQL